MSDEPRGRTPPADTPRKGRRKKVTRERSAGVVVYRDPPDPGRPREFLLLDYGRHWDFAKGHLEAGETDERAARRELREETGIAEVTILPGFCREILYHFNSSRKGLVRKEVAFFVARVAPGADAVTLSEEHVGHAWLPRGEAVDRLTFNNARAVLTGAADHAESADPPARETR